MDISKGSAKKFSSGTDILAQNIFDNELKSVSSNFYLLSGYDFLNFISELCSKLMDVDFVYVAEFIPETNKIAIKAGIEKGKSVGAAEFDIEVKPVKNILQNQFAFSPENVKDKFPEDTELKKNNIQGFAGVPLFDKSGDVSGMFYVYSSKVITNTESIETYLKLFSGRISSELNLIKKEEQLIKSEKKYQTLFETAEDGITLIKGMEFVECNSKSLKIFGCQYKNELIGKTVLDFSPDKQPDDSLSKDKAWHFINETLKGVPQRFFWQHCRKDKTVFDTEVSLNPLTIEDKIHFQAIIRDITEQRRNEERLHESEERFKIIFEYAPEAIYLSDLKGKLILGNLAAEQLMGAPREELMGVNFFDNILAPEDMSKAIEALELNSQGQKTGPNEYRINTREGQKIVEITGFPVRINNEMVALGIARDITERKRNEEKIKDSEERFKIIFEHAPDAMYLNDLQGRLIDGNLAAEKLIGKPRLELVGKNSLEEILDSNDIPKANEALESNAKGLKSGPYEYKIHTEEGEKFIEVSGFPVKIKNELVALGIAREITERKKIENELRESENFIRSIVETSKDWIWAIDINGVHTYSNEAVKNILGYTAAEIINSESLHFIHEEDRNKVGVILDECISGKRGWQNLVLRWKDKNDNWRYLESSSVPILDDKKHIIGFRGVDRDITERIEFEGELIRAKDLAEENERKLLESQRVAQIGSYELDIINGIYHGSDEAKRIIGLDSLTDSYTIDEVWKLLVDPEKVTEKRNVAFQNSDAFEMEFDIKRFDTGEKRTLATTARIKRDENKNPVMVLGLVSDITEKKRSEQELIAAKEKAEESEQQLKLIADNFVNGMIYQVAMLDENRRQFNYVSEAVNKLYGCTVQEAKENSDFIYSKIDPDDINELLEKETEALKSMSVFQTESRVINPDGTTRWSYYISKPRIINGIVCWDGIEIDITERKQLELELIMAKEKAEESEIRFKSISENANDGITLADMEGNYIFVNNAFSALTKYPLEELLQMKVFDIAIDEKDKPYQFNKIGINEEYSVRRQLVCKDKSIIIADIHGKIVEISGEKLALGIVRDMTDIVKWENDLIKAKDKAEESDKLKTAFLLNVSHEIRTPMNGILGFLNLLQQPDLSDVEKSNFMEVVNKSGERLMNTINDIVEISKIESGDVNLVIKEIDISEVMQYHYNFFRIEAEKKGLTLEIKGQIKGDAAIARTDKHKIDGILMNLLKNAIKFTKEGKIEIGNYIENDKLFLYVSDTGLGIPENKLDAIFDRFVQADFGLSRNYEGAGIGLSIVKAHVEALNGSVQVKSEFGKGSTFLVSIPYDPVIITSDEKNDLKISELSPNKPHILIAEDDDFNFLLLEKILADKFKTIRATSGSESVNLFKENPDVAFILMDIKMPGEFDGLEATRRIRQFDKKIPIIAQTAFAHISDKSMAIDAGCTDYISKPFDLEKFRALIMKYYKPESD